MSETTTSPAEIQSTTSPAPNSPKKKTEGKGQVNSPNPNNSPSSKSKKKKSNPSSPAVPQQYQQRQPQQNKQEQSPSNTETVPVSSTKEEVTEATNTQLDASENKIKGNLLNSSWTIWFDGPKTRHDTTLKYEDRLIQVGTFSTVEEFFRYYVYLKKPLELGNENCNIHIFRAGVRPMWEAFPKGGCFIKKVRKPDENEYRNLLGRMWEELVFATVGEAFEDMDVVGIVLSIRPKEDFLCVWNKSRDNIASRTKITDKLKEVWHLEPAVPIEYKPHSKSMKDGSTYRAGKSYFKQ